MHDNHSGVHENGSHATLKHYAGNETEYYRERWTSTSRIRSRAMHEIYLLPFATVASALAGTGWELVEDRSTSRQSF